MRFSHLSILTLVSALLMAGPTAHFGAWAASPHEMGDEAEIAALDLEAQGKLDDAVVKHREALKLVPNSKAFKENAARTLNAAAIAKHEAKDDATAIAYLEEALVLAPNFAAAKESLAALKSLKLNQDGVALLKASDFAGAAAKFTEQLALQPDNKVAKINLDVAEGQILLKDDPAGAVAKFQNAVSLDPDRQFLKDKLAEAQAAADAKAAADAAAKK
jgi:tetratricopeptide (TPR) repeat protein